MKQLWFSALLKGTSVMTGIRTHTLLIRNTTALESGDIDHDKPYLKKKTNNRFFFTSQTWTKSEFKSLKCFIHDFVHIHTGLILIVAMKLRNGFYNCHAYNIQYSKAETSHQNYDQTNTPRVYLTTSPSSDLRRSHQGHWLLLPSDFRLSFGPISAAKCRLHTSCSRYTIVNNNFLILFSSSFIKIKTI